MGSHDARPWHRGYLQPFTAFLTLRYQKGVKWGSWFQSERSTGIVAWGHSPKGLCKQRFFLLLEE